MSIINRNLLIAIWFLIMLIIIKKRHKKSSMKSIEDVIKLAQSQINVRETSKNSSKEIDVYLKTAGSSAGQPWCMAFVYWVFASSGISHNLIKTAWTIAQLKNTKYFVKQPKRGDVFIIKHTATTGHTGIVTKVLSNGDFETIEGNTNNNGSPNGIGVFNLTRKQTKATTFLRVV